MASASNRTHILARELTDVHAKHKATETQLAVAQQSVSTSERSANSLRATIRELESRIEATQIELKSKQDLLEAAKNQLEEERTALTQSEVDRAALLQKLNDPSTLRAQLRHANRHGESPRDDQSPLVIQPDGSVVLATAQPESGSK